MIIGLDKIQSPRLRKDITSLYQEILDEASKTNFARNTPFSTIIYNYVLGMNRPICICDGMGSYNTILDQYDIEVLVDYRVTHGYKPYQSLDEPIHIFFIISKKIARDNKLNDILYGSIH